jgi:hypothetical protein
MLEKDQGALGMPETGLGLAITQLLEALAVFHSEHFSECLNIVYGYFMDEGVVVRKHPRDEKAQAAPGMPGPSLRLAITLFVDPRSGRT